MSFFKKGFFNEASGVLKAKAIEKVLCLRDTHYAALLIVEFLLSMVIVASIIFWLDYRYNVVEFPFNIIIFVAAVFAVLHFYNYTALFRQQREMQRRTSFRIFLLEFLIFVIAVGAVYLYQDPNMNTLVYPYNFILFFLVLLPVVYVYMDEKYLKAF